jgi:hypothetical protein
LASNSAICTALVAANERVVAARTLRGERVDSIRQVVENSQAGECGKQAAGLFRSHGAFRLDRDALAVAIGHGNAHARGADLDRFVAQNLARLVDHLHLFARVAVFLEAADLRDGIEGDRMRERLVLVGVAIERGLGPLEQIGVSLQAGTADGLIGADDDPADAGRVVERL